MKTVQLESEGVNWIVSQLRAGWTLGNLLANVVESRAGSAYSEVPNHIDPNRSLTQAIHPNEHEDWHPDLVMIHRLMGYMGSTHALVVEDDVARPADPWLKKTPEASAWAVPYGTELLWVFREGGEAGLEAFLSLAYSYQLIAAAVSVDMVPTPSRNLEYDQIRAAAESASLIVLSAYDDTGFVYWEPV